MKPWSEVEANPEFQALPDAEKHRAQSQYFDEVVVPQLGPDDLEDARAEFFTQYPRTYIPQDTGEDLGESAFNEALRSLSKVGTGTVEGLAQFGDLYTRRLNPVGLAAQVAIPGAQSLVDAYASIPQSIARGAESVQQDVEEALPVNPILGDTAPVKMAGVTGQVAGQLGTILTGAAFTRIPAMLQTIGLGQAGLLGLETGYQEADRLGVSGWERDALAVAYGAAEAGVESMGGFGSRGFMQGLTGDLRDAVAGNLMNRFAKTALAEGAEEPLTGFLQAGSSNVFAEEDPNNPGFAMNGQPLPTIDPTSAEFWKQRAEEFALGTYGGALFGGANLALSPSAQQRNRNLHQRAILTIAAMRAKPDRTAEEDAELADLEREYGNFSQATLPPQEAMAEEPATEVIPEVPALEEVAPVTEEVPFEAPVEELAVEEVTPAVEAPALSTAAEVSAMLGHEGNQANFRDLLDTVTSWAQANPEMAAELQASGGLKAALVGGATDPARNVTERGDLDTLIEDDTFDRATGQTKIDREAALRSLTDALNTRTRDDGKRVHQAELLESIARSETGPSTSYIDISHLLSGALQSVPPQTPTLTPQTDATIQKVESEVLPEEPQSRVESRETEIPSAGDSLLSPAPSPQEGQIAPSEAQIEAAWEASPEFTQAEELAAQGDLEAAEALEASFREKQAQAPAEAKPVPAATETAKEEATEATAAPTPPAESPIAPNIPQALDPHLLSLGRSQTVTERQLTTELGAYTADERTELQGILQTTDNKPQTLAKALKAFQPQTGGKGSSYARAKERPGVERRDSIDDLLDQQGQIRARRQDGRSKILPIRVTRNIAESMREALTKLLPNAANAWIGTSEEILKDDEIRRSFVEAEREANPSLSLEDAEQMFESTMADPMAEGFTLRGRTYILFDHIGVTAADKTARGAVRRLMIHEDAHEAIEAAIAASPALKAEWESLKNDIAPEDLDELAGRRYPHMANWRSDAQVHNNLAHEYFAEQAEMLEQGGQVDQSLIERFLAWVRKVLAAITGEPQNSFSDSAIMDFIRAGRAARVRGMVEEGHFPLRLAQPAVYPEESGPNPLMSKAEADAMYLKAVRQGDMATAQRMVDSAAVASELPEGQEAVVRDSAGNVIPLSGRSPIPPSIHFSMKAAYPVGAAESITYQAPYPGMTAQKITAYAWPYFRGSWMSERDLENISDLTPEQQAQMETDFRKALADEEQAEMWAGSAFSEERRGDWSFDVYDPAPLQTEEETPGRIHFSLKSTAVPWSEERKQAYDAFHADPNIPESMKRLTEFLGEPTEMRRVKQSLPAMVDFVRSKIGSLWGEEVEVTPENTERVKELAKLAFSRDNAFAEEFSEEFRDSPFAKVDGKVAHEGNVAAGVLQMEILDYAARLAAEGGVENIDLALQLMPYANDVIVGDYFTMSNAGRALQLRSIANRNAGFWTMLSDLAKGEQEYIRENKNLRTLHDAIFSDDVNEEATDAFVADATTSEKGHDVMTPKEPTDDYVLETQFARALELFTQEERNDIIELIRLLEEIEYAKEQLDQITAPSAAARMSLKENMGKFKTKEELQAAIDERIAKAKELLAKINGAKDSSTTKEQRETVTKKYNRATKLLSADAQAKKFLENFANKPKRTKKDPPPWKAAYLEQVKNPKSETEFTAEMLKHKVSPMMARKLFDQAEKASAALKEKQKKEARAKEKQQPTGIQTFQSWVGGQSQDGIADFVDLIASNVTPEGFNRTAFLQSLTNKFEPQNLDRAMLEAVADGVEAQLAEQKETEGPPQMDFDVRAKALVADAIARASDKTKKLADPMTTAIKERLKGNTTSEQLRTRLEALGIEPQTAVAVSKKVEEDIAARAAKRAATALRNAAQAPTKTAEQIIETLDRKQTEWVPAEQKNAVRELAREARRGPDISRGPASFPTWEEYQQKFEALGVQPQIARTLVDRLRRENAKDRANRVIRRRESIANSDAFLNSIARQILRAPLQQQGSVAWRKQAIQTAFEDRGFSPTAAQAAAEWLEYRFSKHLADARERAAIRAAQGLKMQQPALDKIIAAIRSRALDPSLNNPVVKALAREAGFRPLTTTQFQRLAELDQVRQTSPSPTLRANASKEMLRIMIDSKPPKKWRAIITQSWINSALASLSTMALSSVHAVFIPTRRIAFDMAGVVGGVLTKKMKPADAAGMYVQMFDNLIHSFDNFINTARYAGFTDSYTQSLVEHIHQMHNMRAELKLAAETLKDSNSTAKQKVEAAAKLAFASTDYVRRILSTADETWGSVIHEYVLRNEAMRQLVQKGGLTTSVSAQMMIQASDAGQKATQDHMSKTGNSVEATLVGRDATRAALVQMVAKYSGLDAATDAQRTAELEAPMELGNRSPEEAPLWDVVNFGMEGFKKIAWAIRGEGTKGENSPRELIGRMLTGFVTVPANILNRSAYFTPLGIARALYKMKGDPEKTAKYYEETMGTEGQQRMRLVEGIVGTIGFLLLTALVGLDDDDEGLNITGAGPKNRDLADAWKKQGHKPNHIEWVRKDGTVAFSMPWTRGGFDHMSLPFTFIGTINDMKLEGLKTQPKNVDWGAKYALTWLQGLGQQARFFGMKNLISMPSQTSQKSLAGGAAYFAAPLLPWSGLSKSLSRIYTGQTDQSSVRSAALAQLPFVNLSAQPALNALGDQKNIHPVDFFTKASERLTGAGIPMFIGADPKSGNHALYDFFIKRGVSPSTPYRANIERRNGFISDATWERYVKTRGEIIKKEVRKQMPRLRLMNQRDLQNAIERISSDATKEAKRKLGLTK